MPNTYVLLRTGFAGVEIQASNAMTEIWILNNRMNKKIGLSEVKIEWLNKRALVLISIFSHAANKEEGHVIDLRADDVLCKISALIKVTENAELHDIYKRIKREIKVSLSTSNPSTKAAIEGLNMPMYDDCTESANRRRSL